MIISLIARFKNLINSKEIKNTIIVTVGVFIGNVFAYLVQIYLGRSLSVMDYGIFNTLLSVSVIFGVFSNTLATSIVKIVTKIKARYEGDEEDDYLSQLYTELSLSALLAGALFGLVIFIIQGKIATFLNISDMEVILAFSFYLIFAFIRIPPAAFLQGFLRFKYFAVATVLASILRLVSAVLALSFGFSVSGVYLFLGLGSIILYIITSLMLHGEIEFPYERKSLNKVYKGLLKFAGPVLLMQLGMILLNNVDIILVKHYFDGYTAGIYSGLVTVAKVFLFAANTVAIVMFPQMSSAFSKGENIVKRFKPYLALQVVVILVGLFIFKMFPGLIVDVMFGDIYRSAVVHLPKFTLFFGIYVLINFMLLFLLAVERTSVYFIQLIAIVVQVILINFYHDSIDQIINMNLIVSGTLLVGVVLYYLNFVKSYSNDKVL